MARTSSSGVVCQKCGSKDIVVTVEGKAAARNNALYYAIPASLATIVGAVFNVGRIIVAAGVLITIGLALLSLVKPKARAARIVCRNCGYHELG